MSWFIFFIEFFRSLHYIFQHFRLIVMKTRMLHGPRLGPGQTARMAIYMVHWCLDSGGALSGNMCAPRRQRCMRSRMHQIISRIVCVPRVLFFGVYLCGRALPLSTERYG